MANDMANLLVRPDESSSEGRLDSWKEIAAYLKHSERTVRRWQEEGLPVHRHPHKKRAGVYAYKPELDAWWNDGHAQLAEIERAQAAKGRGWQHWRGAAYVAGAVLVLATLLVALNLGGWRARRALTERDTILLADFTNATGEPAFDGTLKQALAVQLEQSPFLNIFPEQRVLETLRYMGRPPNERLTGEIAREVCERQSIKGMLTGSIASLGNRYVIGLEAVNCRTGDSLAREQAEADSREHVLTALGTAATQLRGKLGESLSSIRQFDVPLAQATTSSGSVESLYAGP